METPFLDSHLIMYERLQKVSPKSLLYSQVIEEIKYLKALNENNADKLPVRFSVAELPENETAYSTAKCFADKKLKLVSTLVSADYKTGYREGITHYLKENEGN